MYFVKTPYLIKSMFPNMLWKPQVEDKVLYLTFDDGPIPEVTPWVLEQLAHYDAKATFFCVGDNVKRHNNIYQSVLAAGHAVGNHTMHHKSGWNTDLDQYLDNVKACSEVVNSVLFRPPYGRMSLGQSQALRQDYRIVMWDVLSGDFDRKLSAQQCLQQVKNSAGPGSIIVFHDSIKAFERLKGALPGTLAYFEDRGYRFESLARFAQPDTSVEEQLVVSLA